MTIEQLLDLPPEGLEALSDEELHAALSPYFQFTRPASPITAVTKGGVMRPGAGQPMRRPATDRRPGMISQKQMLNAILSADNITPAQLKAMREL